MKNSLHVPLYNTLKNRNTFKKMHALFNLRIVLKFCPININGCNNNALCLYSFSKLINLSIMIGPSLFTTITLYILEPKCNL